MAPAAGGVAGDVYVDFHHQLRVDELDVQDVAASPSGGFSLKSSMLSRVSYGSPP
jgi:hypothetical protein